MESSRLKGGHPEYNFGCIWREMPCKLNNALIFPFMFFHARKSDPHSALSWLIWVLSFWMDKLCN